MRIVTRIIWSIRFNRISADDQIHPAVILKRRSALGRLSAWKGLNRRRAPLPRIHVLPDRAWAEREQFMYRKLHGLTVECDASGTLHLPRLPGHTLAAVLQEILALVRIDFGRRRGALGRAA